MSNDRSNILVPLLAGLAAGAVLGLLLAPRSGAETREALRKKAGDAKDGLNDLVDEARERWDKAKGRTSEAASMTKDEVQDFVRFLFDEGRDLWDRVKDDHRKHSVRS
ncbi:MAG: YtxH domain-containing protein [Bacteroidetes bacterium]|nr:YtxH domain-containing protein [Bacteroidota bacterium]